VMYCLGGSRHARVVCERKSETKTTHWMHRGVLERPWPGEQGHCSQLSFRQQSCASDLHRTHWRLADRRHGTTRSRPHQGSAATKTSVLLGCCRRL